MIWKQSKIGENVTAFMAAGYGKLTALTLSKSGIENIRDAEEFLHGDELHDPALIRNIRRATDVIWRHVYRGSRICVFGDYDTDGITASAIMFLTLRKLGAQACVRLPDRIEEGYGISQKAIEEQIALGTNLFITVDNGIKAVAETAFVKSNGCDIVILDHHQPEDVLPKADALIDLHIPGETYPNIELTGSGLAWKVAHFMLEQAGEHDYAMSLVDLAAIGTIGDVAPLLGENRVIVKRALKLMRSGMYDRPGIAALMPDLQHVTSEDIAFRISPCLNAPGRLEVRGAELSLLLLLEDKQETAFRLAQNIIAINERRKSMQAECFGIIQTEVEQRIQSGEKVIVVCAKDTPSGIAGLLAGVIREKYNRPAIVLTPKKNTNGEVVWTGSARSIESFHMLDGIIKCKEYLIAFGGHKLAAGLSMKADERVLGMFRDAINRLAVGLDESDLEPSVYWDIEIGEEDLTSELYAEAEALEPFGAGVPKPVIRIEAQLNSERAYDIFGLTGNHLKLYAKTFSMVGFSLSEKYLRGDLPDRVQAIGSLSMNYYRGQAYKQISLLDFEAA